MVKIITLTQGYVTQVDDIDFERFNKYSYHIGKSHRGLYAVRTIILPDGKHKDIRMHREIMNAPIGFEIDHINGDTLDNRRCNLRVCTHSQNTMNKLKRKPHSSRYKGVTLPSYLNSTQDKRWIASIRCQGHLTHIGCFDSEEDAARAYDTKARELFGEFANFNFPEDAGSKLVFPKRKSHSSIYKGVSQRSDYKQRDKIKFIAQIVFKGEHIFLGTFDSEENAAKAYDTKALELFGKYAYTNFDSPI